MDGWRYSVYCFFFFQAEDGIRDDLVTGVQTCALPISVFPVAGSTNWLRLKVVGFPKGSVTVTIIWSLIEAGIWRGATSPWLPALRDRSEERRVGKECRSRWSPYH